ncbi:hypothetical protein Tco_1010207 [Tanacetum coccineum]
MASCVLPSAFSTIANRDPMWNMDTGASSHLNSHTSNLNIIYNKCLYPSVCVGDGKTIPITNIGHSILPTLNRPLYLHNILVTPNIIKNLISVRQFTRDNNCNVEFDVFGFSMKNFLIRHILLRCDSSGDLYPITQPSPIPHALLSVNPTTWHRHLGHPDKEVLRSLLSRFCSGGGGGGSVDVVSVVSVTLEGTSADAVRALKIWRLRDSGVILFIPSCGSRNSKRSLAEIASKGFEHSIQTVQCIPPLSLRWQCINRRCHNHDLFLEAFDNKHIREDLSISSTDIMYKFVLRQPFSKSTWYQIFTKRQKSKPSTDLE